MVRDTGKATVDRDGWFGPIGAGGNSGDVLFHNVRWWSRPRGGDSFRIKWDRPWTITGRLFFSTGRDTSRCSMRMWRCNRSRPGRRQMIGRTSSSSLQDPFRARVQSWLLTRPIVGETLGRQPLDLVEARVVAARAASAVPVRTAVDVVR